MSENRICSFCGEPVHRVEVLIVGETANICSRCIELSVDLIGAYRVKQNPGKYHAVTEEIPAEENSAET